jgi:hypothetical protein
VVIVLLETKMSATLHVGAGGELGWWVIASAPEGQDMVVSVHKEGFVYARARLKESEADGRVVQIDSGVRV